jgi:hypothetical protein
MQKIVAVPVLLALGYFLFGSLVRVFFTAQIDEGRFKATVLIAAALSGLATLAILARWRSVTGRLSSSTIAAGAAAALVVVQCGYDVMKYVQWTHERSFLNYEASRKLGEIMPPGTLIQGKMANGLDLENRIRPVFIGRDFGNYADRFDRNDVRYILTYVETYEGGKRVEYAESSPGLIKEILDHYPQRRTVATFDVDETPGIDRVALIDKFGGNGRQ